MRKLNKKGRVPYAFAAAVFVAFLMLFSIYVGTLNNYSYTNTAVNLPTQTDNTILNVENQIANEAYFILMDHVNTDSNLVNPPLNKLSSQVYTDFSNYVSTNFPEYIGTYNVSINSFSIYVTFDPYIAVSQGPSLNTINGNGFSVFPPSELYSPTLSSLQKVYSTPYPAVVGNIYFTIQDVHTSVTIQKEFTFTKVLMSPLGLLRSSTDNLARNAEGSNSEISRLTQYILTTIAQIRVLEGYGGGGYDTNMPGVSSIITQTDVQNATNIAILLASMRYFRAYDPNAVDNFVSSISIPYLQQLISQYINNGTVDPADIYLLIQNQQNSPTFDVGKVLGQSIYSFADRFLYDLLYLFWAQALVDPVLQEPIVNWNLFWQQSEQWAMGMLHQWMLDYEQWLNLASSIPGQTLTIQIPALIVTESGVTTDVCNDPPVPVAFTGEYTVVPSGFTWTLSRNEVADTINLLLGNSNSPNFLPDPFTLVTSDSFSNVGQRTYNYYLVDKSLIQEFSAGSSVPYKETLEKILYLLKNGTNARSPTLSDTADKGLLDYIAYEISQVGTSAFPISNTQLAPSNPWFSPLTNGSAEFLGSGSAMDQALSTFWNDAQNYNTRLNWWVNGAYHLNNNNFIWYAAQQSVRLWYQVIVNLYEGAIQPINFVYGFAKTTQQSQGVNQNGWFNFPQDMMRDIIYRIYTWTHSPDGSFDGVSYDQYWNGLSGPCYQPDPALIAEGLAYAQYGTEEALWAYYEPQFYSQIEGIVGSPGLTNIITSTMNSNMNTQTDNGQFNGNGFQGFVAKYIGAPIIGTSSSNTGDVVSLAQPNGWETQIMQNTVNYINANSNLSNIVTKPYVSLNRTYIYWKGNRNLATDTGQIFNETELVKYMDDSLNTVLVDPSITLHLVDAQDTTSNMGISPFVTTWNVNVTGTIDSNVSTLSYVLGADGSLHHTNYNHTYPISLAFPVTVFSGWPLQTGWNGASNDPSIVMTRKYFGIMGKDHSSSPDFITLAVNNFISVPLNQVIQSMYDSAHIVQRLDAVTTHYIVNYGDVNTEESANLTENLSTAYQLTNNTLSQNFGSSYTSNVQSLMNTISGRVNNIGISTTLTMADNSGFFGYNATLSTNSGSYILNYHYNQQQGSGNMTYYNIDFSKQYPAFTYLYDTSNRYLSVSETINPNIQPSFSDNIQMSYFDSTYSLTFTTSPMGKWNNYLQSFSNIYLPYYGTKIPSLKGGVEIATSSNSNLASVSHALTNATNQLPSTSNINYTSYSYFLREFVGYLYDLVQMSNPDMTSILGIQVSTILPYSNYSYVFYPMGSNGLEAFLYWITNNIIDMTYNVGSLMASISTFPMLVPILFSQAYYRVGFTYKNGDTSFYEGNYANFVSPLGGIGSGIQYTPMADSFATSSNNWVFSTQLTLSG
jgi:hypothetical protein